MNAIRLYFTATVAFLVVAIGGRVTSSMNNTVRVRKCCPVDRMYDPEARFCRLVGTDVDEYEQRLMNRLRRGFRVEAYETLKIYHDVQLYCIDGEEVLIDVPAEEMPGLMEAHPSPIVLPSGYCFDLTPSDKLVARTCRPRIQYCGRGKYTCVNKCCDNGDIMVYDPNLGNLDCNKSEMQLKWSAYETDAGGSPPGLSNNTVLPYWDGFSCSAFNMIDNRFKLTTDGNLILTNEGVKWIIPETEYCLDYYAKDGTLEAAELNAVLCYSNAKPPVSFNFWVKTLSVVCLVLTLIVYATLPYLRNTHGYYVMFYMACQLVYLVCIMIYSLVHDDVNSPLCILFGYFMLFATLTTCCWLNVICFDIYWMLRYNNSTNRNTSKLVRTIMYHIYCWGFSSICVSTGYLFQHSQHKKLLNLAPDIGEYRCFFSGIHDYGTLIFYWLPSCGMLIANLILFLLTAIHCSRIKSELNKFRRTESKIEIFLVYKARFVMSMKLFLVFGVPFLFSMLCELFRIEGIIQLIIDSIHNLQGVFIFIIFVAKFKIIMDLRKKCRRSIVHSELRPLNNISRSS
ncbi:unnamed protein product [Macrosiphum euphorbiae]|uniref:G-protein coupled receptors family 2 profile 2 domain-containing protein n=1 Tax=Macrosiphum euphorbiae TaxID=13131 RepID=A0AAV0VIB1_9HEMI|nr:unnamed protein product [Macrosiphum euphorbiae]